MRDRRIFPYPNPPVCERRVENWLVEGLLRVSYSSSAFSHSSILLLTHNGVDLSTLGALLENISQLDANYS